MRTLIVDAFGQHFIDKLTPHALLKMLNVNKVLRKACW